MEFNRLAKIMGKLARNNAIKLCKNINPKYKFRSNKIKVSKTIMSRDELIKMIEPDLLLLENLF